MNKVKITVLKATLDQELAEEYGVEGLSACPMPGPDRLLRGLCETGRPLRPSLESNLSICFSLAHGGGNGLFYYGDWIRKPGVAICKPQRWVASRHLQA